MKTNVPVGGEKSTEASAAIEPALLPHYDRAPKPSVSYMNLVEETAREGEAPAEPQGQASSAGASPSQSKQTPSSGPCIGHPMIGFMVMAEQGPNLVLEGREPIHAALLDLVGGRGELGVVPPRQLARCRTGCG